MNIPILIEPIANNGFRATGGLPFAITVEGATRDEALGRLRAEIDRRMASAARSWFRWKSPRPRQIPGSQGAGCSGTMPCSTNGRRPSRNTVGRLIRMPKCHEPVRAGCGHHVAPPASVGVPSRAPQGAPVHSLAA